jgi:AraC-like DNA-binding protein
MAVLNAKETKKRIEQLGLETKHVSDFALREKFSHLSYDWHAHSRHQLLYSLSGRIELETTNWRWLLFPQRAAWIPAGTSHRTTIDRAETISIYFKKVPNGLLLRDIRIMPAPPLLREMLIHATRWPVSRRVAPDPIRSAFFRTLALLCREWVTKELSFRLPVSQDARIEKAVGYLRAHLDTCGIEEAAHFSGQSVRTLRRRFEPAMNMSWRDYRQHAAVLQGADSLLNSTQSVVQIALAVGYESPSAFSKAFARFAGVNPLAFRQANIHAQTIQAHDSSSAKEGLVARQSY